MSPRIGGEIGDRFGQTITLELMMALFQTGGDEMGFLATVARSRELLVEIRDHARLAPTLEIWSHIEKRLSPQQLAQLTDEAPALLDHALAAARKRFGDSDPRRLD